MPSKRYHEIDNLYALGTLLVIFGHSHSSDWTRFDATPLKPIILFIYTFHMPLFFLIAGFLFMNSHRLDRDGYGKWIGDKALKLLTPYAVISLLAAVPKYYFEHHGLSGLFTDVVKGLFAPRQGVWGHFWFLPVLFMVYVIFGAIKVLIKDKFGKNCIIILTAIAFTVYFIPLGTEWFGINDLKDSLLFFTAGMLICEYKLNETAVASSVTIALIVSGTVISAVLFGLFDGIRPVMLLTGIIMLCVCCLFAKLLGENKLTAWISRNNFTIYIYSWPFQAAAMILCDKFDMLWFVTLAIMFTTGMFMPVAILWIYKKLSFLNNKFFDLVLGIK